MHKERRSSPMKKLVGRFHLIGGMEPTHKLDKEIKAGQ
jgi:hypothetical protein